MRLASVKGTALSPGTATTGYVASQVAAAATAVPGTTASPLKALYARITARDKTAVPIVATGSSTPAGTGASTQAQQIMERWVAGIQADFPLANGAAQPIGVLLGSQPSPLPLGIQLIKAAGAGGTAGNYLDSTKIAAIGSLNPALVLHQVTANDYTAQRDPVAVCKPSIVANLDALDAAIKDAHVHVLVHAHRSRTAPAATYPWSAYGAMLKSIADARANVVFVDLGTPFHDAGNDTTDPLTLMSTDNIHLTDAGHAYGASLLRSVVRLTVPLSPTVPGSADPTGDYTVPSAPTNLSANPSNGQASLAWTAATDNVAVAKYRVRNGGTLLAEPAGTSYTVTGLTNGTSYTFTVAAVDSSNNESATTAVTVTPVTTPDTTAPSTPTNLTATPGNALTSLTWTASTDNVAVTGYRVRRGGTVVGSPTGTSFIDTGLTNGTQYSYTVSAVDAAGNESAQTTAVSATPVSSGGSSPSLPTVSTGTLSAWRRADSLSLSDGASVASWDDSSPNGYTATQATSAAQPVFKPAVVNSLPVVRFSGAQFLGSSAPSSLPRQTIFAVMRPTGTNGDTVRGSSGQGLQVRLFQGKVSLILQNVSIIGQGNTVVSTAGFSVVCWAYSDGVSWAAYLNGAADGGGSAVTNLTVTGLTSFIGAKNTGSEPLIGDLAETIVYDGLLSNADRAAVTAYLGQKYAIAVS